MEIYFKNRTRRYWVENKDSYVVDDLFDTINLLDASKSNPFGFEAYWSREQTKAEERIR